MVIVDEDLRCLEQSIFSVSTSLRNKATFLGLHLRTISVAFPKSDCKFWLMNCWGEKKRPNRSKNTKKKNRNKGKKKWNEWQYEPTKNLNWTEISLGKCLELHFDDFFTFFFFFLFPGALGFSLWSHYVYENSF